MDWQKIKEKIQERIGIAVLSLVAFLCLAIWQAVPAQAWEQLGAVIPKRALAALIALLLIGLSGITALVFSLRRKLKKHQAAAVDSPPSPYLRYSGILWDDEDNPFC